MRVYFLLPCLVLAPLAVGQTGESNPTVNFTTPAVRASVALQGLGKAVDRRLRVEAPLADQPLILRLHNAPYEDTLKWIANVLHGTWEDRNGYKTLHRTTTISMLFRNSVFREQSRRYFEIVQRRLVAHQRSVLDRAFAEKTILALQNPSDPGYANARHNSGEIRLIDGPLQVISSNDIAGGGSYGRWVFSNRPRPLQGSIRMMEEELAALYQDQNTWTTALQGLTKTHPELSAAARSRRLIDPKHARLVVVMSRPVESVPTFVEAHVVDDSGQDYVYASDVLADPPEAGNSASDWGSRVKGTLQLDPTSKEYIAVAASDGATPISDALRAELKNPLDIDPLRHGVSDGLLSIAEQGNLNLVASPPDATAFPATVAKIGEDAGSLLNALDSSCEITIENGLMTVRPRDPFRTELARTDRKALQEYLEAVDRVGYSSFNAETDFMGATGPRTNIALATSWARLLRPSATPFAGSPEGLSWYGILSVDQRKLLLTGFPPLTTADMTPKQQEQLTLMSTAPSGQLVLNGKPVFGSGLATEMSQIVDSTRIPNQSVVLKVSTEPMLRVVGIDSKGDRVDRTVRLQDAAKFLQARSPWRSVAYASGTATLRRLVVKIGESAEAVHSMPEFSQPMSPLGPAESLPPTYRKALQESASGPGPAKKK